MRSWRIVTGKRRENGYAEYAGRRRKQSNI